MIGTDGPVMPARLYFVGLAVLVLGLAAARPVAAAAIGPNVPQLQSPSPAAASEETQTVTVPPQPSVVNVPPSPANAANPILTGTEPTVTVTPQQAVLILGVDTGTVLRIDVAEPNAGPVTAGRLMATVGTLGPLQPGPTSGSYVVEYKVPADRRPQSAIIAIEVVLGNGRRIHGTTQLMLPAAADFPLRSSPHANVYLEIAGTEFGPRRADGEGNVVIPIVVPPGLAIGRARAVNRFGVAKETEVDLQPADYQRVLLLAPTDGEAGATVEVEVWAVDPTGDPSLPEDVDLKPSAGRVRRLGGVPGVAVFAFTLPQKVETKGGAGAVALVASMDDGTSVRPDAMVVHPGPPATIAITSDSDRLVVAGDDVAHLSVVASDRFGNVVPSHQGLSVSADGRPLSVEVEPTGAQVAVSAPPVWAGRDHVAVEAMLGGAHAAFHVPVGGGEPARMQLTPSTTRVDANGANAVDLVLEVFDERGTPTTAEGLQWQTEDDGAITSLPAPRFGVYAARFVPRRALRDRSALLTAIAGKMTGKTEGQTEGQTTGKTEGTTPAPLNASTRVSVEAGATRTAAARVGIASNLGSGLGQAAFLEATVPLRRLGRFGRLVSAGVAVGYLHRDLTTSPAASFPAVHVEVNQAPVMALARVRVPGALPVELSVSGSAGVTFATTQITPGESAFGVARGTARAFVVGAGADASVLLQPGELIIGARYLHAELGANSNGDQVDGNSVGLVCDLGFRIGF